MTMSPGRRPSRMGSFSPSETSRPSATSASPMMMSARPTSLIVAPNSFLNAMQDNPTGRGSVIKFGGDTDAENESRSSGTGDPGGDCRRARFRPGAPAVTTPTVRPTGGAHRALSGPAAGANPGRGDLPQRYSAG